MVPQINALRAYSIVILTDANGVISRSAGSDLSFAKAAAKGRREDFPTAKEVRVVCSRDGVIASY